MAIATPPGRGGIGVVRLSGPDAQRIALDLTNRSSPFVPRRATLTRLARAADEVVVTAFAAPASYTGEDVVEISAHGSPIVLRLLVEDAIRCGARLADPGEFTLRAYLNGRLDLVQAEAVDDLVSAVTPLQAQVAFDQLQGTLTRAIAAIDAHVLDVVARLEASIDFPDEGYHFIEPDQIVAALDEVLRMTAALIADGNRGRLVREGLQVAILGRPNVGKSSLFNALVGAPRAIVTDVPGTTRDLVSEAVDIGGLRITLVDTAGIRDTDDVVESEGVARSHGAAASSSVGLVVLDGTRALDAEDFEVLARVEPGRRIIVQSKADQGSVWGFDQTGWTNFLNDGFAVNAACVRTSTRTGEGLDAVRDAIIRVADAARASDPPAITNVRHLTLVTRAHEALGRAREAAREQGAAVSEEFVLADLQDARAALDEIVGKRTPDDVLAHIFERFCIGK